MMYVYLATTGAEVFLPGAVECRATEDELVLLDDADTVVAVFPARIVLAYSRQPIAGATDGNAPDMPSSHPA